MFENLFTTKGRARRSEWWLFGLAAGILAFAMVIGLLAILDGVPLLGAVVGERTTTAAAVMLGVQLLCWWPLTAVMVRRAHDRNNAGTWAVVYQVISLATAAFEFPQVVGLLGPDYFLPVYAAAMIPVSFWGIWMLVTQGFLDGTPGPNRYGPSPKGVESNYAAPRVD